ncbi:MAG: hypothetical protein G01um10148_739 [Parcubacteria group bacterium Gr01-1014_8]|nr:MAG: hypothetical protein G01um10148_739 [Parcubacteria group bacterium Gr01-1014_8]
MSDSLKPSRRDVLRLGGAAAGAAALGIRLENVLAQESVKPEFEKRLLERLPKAVAQIDASYAAVAKSGSRDALTAGISNSEQDRLEKLIIPDDEKFAYERPLPHGYGGDGRLPVGGRKSFEDRSRALLSYLSTTERDASTSDIQHDLVVKLREKVVEIVSKQKENQTTGWGIYLDYKKSVEKYFQDRNGEVSLRAARAFQDRVSGAGETVKPSSQVAVQASFEQVSANAIRLAKHNDTVVNWLPSAFPPIEEAILKLVGFEGKYREGHFFNVR